MGYPQQQYPQQQYPQQQYPPQQYPQHGAGAVVAQRVEPDINSQQNKELIPIMPMGWAIFCCILNIFPGLGTIVAGFLALCGLANPGSNGGSKAGTFCANFWIGLAQ